MARALTIDPDDLRRLGRLPRAETVQCLSALCELVESFGQPHVHRGLGIRKLGHKLFENR